MMKNYLRSLCIVLIVALLSNMLPLSVFAENLQLSAAGQITNKLQQTETDKPVITEELVQNRTEYGKQFRLSNGLFLAVEYPEAVHFQKNGSWEEIDNTLTAKDGSYTNTAGLWRVQLPQQISNNSIVIEKDGYTLSFSLTGELKNTGLEIAGSKESLTSESTAKAVDETAQTFQISGMQLSTATLVELDTAALRESAEHPEAVITKNRSALTYQNVFANTHIRYDLQSNTVKESIELQSYNSKLRGFRYTLNTGGMVPVLEADNSIRFYSPDQKQVIMIMPAPYMVDANMAYCRDVQVALTGKGSTYTLTYLLPQSWLADSSRAWPVILDPVVQAQSTMSNIVDQNVYSLGYADPNAGVLQCGYVPQVGISRAYLKYNQLPFLSNADVIVKAEVRLCEYRTSTTTCCVSVHKVLENWTEGQMQWNSRVDYDPTVEDYVQCLDSTYYKWDITDIARGWYEGENTGMMFKLPDAVEQSGRSNYVQFWSADFSIYQIQEKPTLFVYYRSNVGIEPYYSYATLGAGSAGTAYIADATGQLKAAKQLVSYASTVNPFAMNLVYNSDYFNFDGNSDGYLPAINLNTNMEMGHGWTLDIIQRIEPETINGITYLKYTDGDGTKHHFARPDTTKYPELDASLYYDEDGLGLKVEDKGGNSYVMSNDKDITWTFTDNLLTEMADANGNKILIVYNTNKQITKVQQQNNGKTAIDVAAFAYNGNVLQSVTDAAGNVYTLVYTDGELTSISMNNVTVAEYTYNAHRLTSLEDTDSGYTLTAQYDSNGKVDWYKESVSTPNGTADGVAVDIEYENDSKTTYRDYGNDRTKGTADDILTSYLFDYWGRTANVYTTDAAGNILGASNAVYTASDGVDKRNNRTLRSASIGVAAQQLLLNSGFEDTEANAWTLGSAVSLDSAVTRTGNKVLKFIGEQFNSSQTNASKITLPLIAGQTYTLSGYANTSQASIGSSLSGVLLRVSDGTNTWSGDMVNYTTSSTVDDGWVRFSVTFTAQQSVAHTVTIRGVGAIGNYYVDDLQLEVGEAPANRNLLENGNMETANYAWTHTDTSTVDATTPVSFVSADGRNVLRILGNPDSETTASTQTVMLNLPGSQTYVLSGWVKADAVPDSIETNEDPAQDLSKQCGLRAILYYADDSNNETEDTEYHYVSFNSDLTDWQFTSLTIVPKQAERTVEKMDVVCAYERNANIAYFDNLSLVREVAQTYTYDEDGNLVSVTTTGLKEDVDTYENGNLIQSVTGGQGTYSYAYNNESNKHLVTAASNGQITQAMTYDGIGNATGTTLFATPTSDLDTDGKIKEDEDGNKLITEEPSCLYLQTSAEYSADGNLQTEITDSSGSKVTYEYGTEDGEIDNSVMWGLPTTITGPNSAVTTTTYDSFGRIIQNSVANGGSLLYNYNKGQLEEIVRSASGKTQKYSFTYDNFGNVTSVMVGGIELVENTYGIKNGQLLQQTFSNGASVSFAYDELGRIKTETRREGETVTCTRTYTYTGDGQLFSVRETKGQVSTLYLYTYDTLGRLIGSEKKTGGTSVLRTHQTYNENNQLVGQAWQMGSNAYSETFTYSEVDGSLNSHTTATGQTVDYTYDVLRRLLSVKSGELYTKHYTYRDIIPGQQTTTQVAGLAYSGLTGTPTYGYTYDAMGNITTYTAGGVTLTYVYDTQGQLTQVKNGDTLLYGYTYDAAGNILTATEGTATHTYTYGNADWVDLLTAYDGQSITYDAIGNPTSYYNGTRWSFTWQNGKRLAAASDGTTSLSFAYDADGMRTAKTVNGVTHSYIYASGMLLRESDGTNTLDFFYDAGGAPYAINYNGTLYYYITNLQDDILHIVDASGETVVSYEYDPYGKLLSTGGTMADTLGMANPLRYRGYYYDAELGMYYLQSRYYDPGVGRFINADDVAYLGADGSSTSYNLFAYCNNNPVMGYDPAGTINWGNILKAAAIVVAVTAVVALTVATAGAAAVAAGAVSATVATAATVGAVVGGVAAGASEIIIQCNTRGSDNLDYTSIGIETFVGSANGALDGASATLASASGKLACKAGKIVVSAVGSVSHSINQGKSVQDTLSAATGSVCASIVIQGGLAGYEHYLGKLNTTMLEQNLLDGAMTYGIDGMLKTIGVRVISNAFRNRNRIIETVF